MSVMEAGGFTLVSGKRNRGRKRKPIRVSKPVFDQHEKIPDTGQEKEEEEVKKENVESLIKRIRSIPRSPCLMSFVTSILKTFDPNHLICLGLGPFSSCHLARCQLSFLIDLMSELDSIKVVEVADPIFSALELDVLRKLGLKADLIQSNLKIEQDFRTLFFMPHCPRELTNAVLEANQTFLSNIVLFCNSFESMRLRLTDANLIKEAGRISDVMNREVVKEASVEDSLDEDVKDVFNDMAVHTFREQTNDIYSGKDIFKRDLCYEENT